MTTDDRRRHTKIGPSPTEAAMLEVYDCFEQLLATKPRVAATFAAETLEKAKALTESMQKPTQKG